MSLLDKAVAAMRPSLETMVAGGAAIVTGAAVYLMPVELLQNAVIASGLPDVLPPLDPPLGGKARIGLALVAAGFVFGIVALLVRLLLGKSKPKARKAKAREPTAAKAVKPATAVTAMPKLRRRDRHPDAPARAPLSIGREIGVPDEEAVERVPLAKGFTASVATTPVVAEEPVRRAEVPVVEPEPVPVVEEMLPPVLETVPEPVEVARDNVSHPMVADAAVAQHPTWLEANVVEGPARSEPSLTELLARLETAMARRGAPAVAAAASAAPVAASDDADGRLRSALESLKKFAPQRR